MRTGSPLIPLALAIAVSLASAPVTGATPAQAADEPATAGPQSLESVLDGLKSKDVGERRRAAEAALTQPGPKVVLPLVKLLRDENSDVRRAAVVALGARRDAGAAKSAAKGLAARLRALEKQSGEAVEFERLEFIDALHDLAQPGTIKALADGVDNDTPEDEVTARFRAIANVPRDEAIETLIQELAGGRRRGKNSRNGAAGVALQYATGQRLGRDPDKWRAWWKEVKRGYDHAAAAQARAAGEQKKRDQAERREERRRKREGGDGDSDGKGKGKRKKKKDGDE